MRNVVLLIACILLAAGCVKRLPDGRPAACLDPRHKYHPKCQLSGTNSQAGAASIYDSPAVQPSALLMGTHSWIAAVYEMKTSDGANCIITVYDEKWKF